MAQVLSGFRPVRHVSGAPYNGQVTRYVVSSADTVALNIGDLVSLSATPWTNNIDGGVYPAVTRAGTSTTTPVTSATIVGSVVGFLPNYANLNISQFKAASTTAIVFVADAPDLVFAAAQSGTAGAQVTNASIGLNVSLVPGLTSTSAPYASGMTVSSASVSTTSTLPLRVVGVTNSPDNDPTSTTRVAELLVMINTHQLAFNTQGV